MGFSPLPPKPDPIAVFNSLEMWTRRADAGILHAQLPWAAMLAGSGAATEVAKDPLQVANYYRAKGLHVVVVLDPTDGLNRAAEAPELVVAQRSLTEPAIQQLYRQYAAAVVSQIDPEYLGLAAETNLIRAVAPAPLYAAVKQAANDAAADLGTGGTATKLFVSVQVETAWGLLPQVGGYVGIAPEQARYFRQQARLLDQANALYLFQLTFTDLDLSSFPPPTPSNLSFFAYLGLVDANLGPKPAIAGWDSLFALRRQ